MNIVIGSGLLVRHNSKSEQPLKRLKIGAKSELLQGRSLKRLKIGAKSELLQGGAVKNAPFNIRKKQRTYEKFEFLAQTPPNNCSAWLKPKLNTTRLRS